ncbi:MAG: cyclic-di-AMP receptor [bacterium]|nr:cyclic-di-AMP receptor [bacterium]
MKLVVAVVQDKDAPKLLQVLVDKDYRATKLASTGGFLKEGNTTLLLGVADDAVDDVVGLIKATCKSRDQLVTPLTPVGGPVDSYVPYPVEVLVGGATIFVLSVERHEKA